MAPSPIHPTVQCQTLRSPARKEITESPHQATQSRRTRPKKPAQPTFPRHAARKYLPCAAQQTPGSPVSPRPAPSRHDATARQFLRAAVQLIDAYLDDQPRDNRPARLRSIKFPAALDWLRTEDVIRLAATEGTTGVSRKAFFNRWPTRDEFLPDA